MERFWRTLNEELLEGTTFETAEELREELALYLLYYNTARPHQGLGGKTPLQGPAGSVNELLDIYRNDVGAGDPWRRGLRPVYGASAPNGFLPMQE